MPLPLMLVAVLAAVGIVAFVLTTLRRDGVQTGETSADRTFRSALLPDDWSTYGGDTWSVGVPDDWEVTVDGGATLLHPSNAAEAEREDYFAVTRVEGTVDNALAQYEGRTDIVESSSFLFAGYETVKYVLDSGRTFYVIDYAGQAGYVIGTRYNDDAEISIMLATFQFLY